MTISPSTERTLYRFLAVFLASGAADALVQFATTDSYDWRHLAGALVAAAVLAVEKVLSEGNDAIAAPTVRSVSTALNDQAALAGTIPAPLVPPTQPSPAPTPPKPFDTLPPAP